MKILGFWAHLSVCREDLTMNGWRFAIILTYCAISTGSVEESTVSPSNKNSTSPNSVIENVVPTNIPAISTNAITTTRRPLLQGLKLPCSCIGGQCGCCTGMILERFKQKACMNLTYDPDEFAITASMSMNKRVLYKNTVTGKNPPPMCIRVPRFRFIQFCVEFSNIYFAKRNIHLCIDAEANWEDFTVMEWSFDCVRLGVSGVAVIGPEEGGGLPLSPLDEEDQIDEDYDDSARNVPIIDTLNKPFHVEILKGGEVLISFNRSDSNYFNEDFKRELKSID